MCHSTTLMCHCEERSDVAISGRKLRFRRWLSHDSTGYGEIATSPLGPRNDKFGGIAPLNFAAILPASKAVTTRKGHAASVRRQSRQRLRSDRRYRRNRCVLFLSTVCTDCKCLLAMTNLKALRQ